MHLRLKLFTTLLLSFVGIYAGAQTGLRPGSAGSAACVRTFLKEYADSSHSAFPRQLFVTDKQQILIAALERVDPNVANDQSSLALLDTNGNVIKTRYFNGKGPFYIDKIVKLGNGNFAAAGEIGTTPDSSGLAVLEFDQDLNILWEKAFHFALDYRGFLDMVESSEGGLYLYLRDQYSSNTESRQLLKLNAAGTPVWLRQYGAGSNIFTTQTEIDGKLTELGDYIYLKYNEESYLIPHILKIRKDDGSVVWGREYRLDSIMGPYSISIFSFFNDGKSIFLNGRTNGTDVLLKIDTANGQLLRQFTHSHNGLYLGRMIYTASGKIIASAGDATGAISGVVEMDRDFNVLRQQFLQVPSPGPIMDLTDYSDSVNFALGNFFNNDPNLNSLSLAKFNFESSFASCQVTNPSFTFQPLDTWVVTVINLAVTLPLPDVVSVTANPVQGTLAYSRYYCGNQPLCNTLSITGPATLCDSGTYHYSALRNPGCDAHVNWIMEASSDSVEMLGANDTSVGLHIVKAGVYHLQAKIFGSCQWVSDSMKIDASVDSHRALSLGHDTTICNGNSITLNAGAGFSSYRWQDGSTDTLFLVHAPGKYFVTVTAGCNNKFSDTVVVAAHPPIPFGLGGDTSLCFGDSIIIHSPGGFSHYQWAPAVTKVNDSWNVVIVKPLLTTVYSVQADADAGCTVHDSLRVKIKNIPTIDLGKDTSFCAGQSIALDAGPGFDTYAWSTGENNQKITAATQSIYSVTATLNGCSSSDSISVLHVFPLPSFSLGDDTTLCEGQGLSFSFALAGASYLWSTGSTSGNTVITSAGKYWLQVTEQGCSASDSLLVNSQPSPAVHLGNDTTICEGASITLSAFNQNASYLWQDGSTASSYEVTTAGAYTATAFINGCSSADTINVRLTPLPKFTLGGGQNICSGQHILLAPPMNTVVSYLWQDRSMLPSFLVTQKGTYSLTASNTCGSYTDSVTISTGFCSLYMPNAFTPNGDGLNDIFRVKYSFPVRSFLLRIYDRFGEKVFESSDILKGWDGTFKGKNALMGTYIWTLTLVTSDGSTENRKGIVTLAR